MPIYVYGCEECKETSEIYQHMGASAPACCGLDMAKRPTLPADYTTNTNRSARRRWMRDWTPESKPFQTCSIHGEKS